MRWFVEDFVMRWFRWILVFAVAVAMVGVGCSSRRRKSSGSGGTTLKADFEATPTQGKASLTVNFTDRSTGNPISWEWDFDNNGTVDSTQQNPIHTYSNPGWYTVKLTVSDGTNTNTCVKKKYILVASSIYYVDGVNGDDTNTGTSWSDAFATIGKALSAASDYDLVLVADATYNETNLNFNGKKIYLKGVDHNNAGQQPVIDCQQAGRAFFFGSGETGDSVIDNFAIKNGSADYGGAIWCDSSSPTLSNCTFSNNSANYGGAIYCGSTHGSSNPTITNCTFSGNGADDYGGAIWCDGSAPSITECTFSGNSSSGHGGAICCYLRSNANITNCIFNGNSASRNGGAIYCDLSSNPNITNCTFGGNTSGYYGGAISSSDSSPSVTNCTFSRNNAKEQGGAAYCYHGCPCIINCALSANSASNGGAIFCDSSSLSITNCTFSTNNANYSGGAIYCYNSSPNITNCTFGGNSANYDGGAIYCDSSCSPVLNNCILWNDSAGSSGSEVYIWDSGSSCTLNYCCVDNTGYGGQTGNITENNCIHSDPKFACVEAGVLRLKHDSPCIDAGDSSLIPAGVTTDIMGCSRIVGSSVDIGAYEVQGIIYVDGVSGDDANSGADWSSALKTIGAGLSAADDGWIVVVADATYNEINLDFVAARIYLEGTDHNTTGAQPVIDCQGGGRAFYFNSGETEDCIVGNFMIKNGSADFGGAVCCRNFSSPSIIDCAFIGNSAFTGGAIYCENSSPTIANCAFSGNSATGIYGSHYGGAIYCKNSSPTLINCIFRSNSADEHGGAIYCTDFSSPTLTNCLFSGNSAGAYTYGGAIFCYDSSSPTLNNCTFSGNSAHAGGAIYCNTDSSPTLNNCILWGDSATGWGDEIFIYDSSCTCTLNYCCVDNTGYGGQAGNITENNCVHQDPQFVDAAGGDYHLKDTSPCVDAGDNGSVPTGTAQDLDGNQRIVDGDNDGTATVDIGAYEYQP